MQNIIYLLTRSDNASENVATEWSTILVSKFNATNSDYNIRWQAATD